MSYCRWGPESDVYCYKHFCKDTRSKNYEGWTLRIEKMGVSSVIYAYSLRELKNIFIDLRDKGFKFPERVFDRINRELKNKI
jgi:hypothetical protein